MREPRYDDEEEYDYDWVETDPFTGEEIEPPEKDEE